MKEILKFLEHNLPQNMTLVFGGCFRNFSCALKCSLWGQNGGQIWNQHEILYKISPDFSYIGRIVQLDWIWPPFWGQRSHTRAQELFLFSFLVVLRVWTGLQTPKSYFGASCVPKTVIFLSWVITNELQTW